MIFYKVRKFTLAVIKCFKLNSYNNAKILYDLNFIFLASLFRTKMPEKKRQITISRHAIFVDKKVNDEKSINQPIWWLPIARLYSGYRKDSRKDSREKYGLTTKMAPVSFSRADIDGGEMVYAIQTREAG